jgi:hypothetical protein
MGITRIFVLYLVISALPYSFLKRLNDNIEFYEGKIVKGTRNGLYLIRSGVYSMFVMICCHLLPGKKSLFPDFHTFTSMGFNLENITSIPDSLLESLSKGDPIVPIPVYRLEDFMFHNQCEDPDRMVFCSSFHTMSVI